jgi:hypothetical protein
MSITMIPAECSSFVMILICIFIKINRIIHEGKNTTAKKLTDLVTETIKARQSVDKV